MVERWHASSWVSAASRQISKRPGRPMRCWRWKRKDGVFHLRCTNVCQGDRLRETRNIRTGSDYSGNSRRVSVKIDKILLGIEFDRDLGHRWCTSIGLLLAAFRDSQTRIGCSPTARLGRSDPN